MKVEALVAGCAALSLALATAQPARAAEPARQAEPPVHKATDLIGSVTTDDLRALVLAEGHMIDDGDPPAGTSVRGKTAGGLLFMLFGTACEGAAAPACLGLMMQVRYDADERVTAEGVNAANLQEAAVGTWWDKDDGTVGFTRYVVLDQGVTWMNLRHNLRVLLDVESTAQTYVFPADDRPKNP